MFSAPADDANVQWRIEASRAVFAQIREQPLFGVGFGRRRLLRQRRELERDCLCRCARRSCRTRTTATCTSGPAADSSALGLRLDPRSRYRGRGAAPAIQSRPDAAPFIFWAAATCCRVSRHRGFGHHVVQPGDLLTIWALLVLPAVVLCASPNAPGASRRRRHARELTAANPDAAGIAASPGGHVSIRARRRSSGGVARRRWMSAPRLSQIATDRRCRRGSGAFCPGTVQAMAFLVARRDPALSFEPCGFAGFDVRISPPGTGRGCRCHARGGVLSTSSWPPRDGGAFPSRGIRGLAGVD